MSAEGLTQEETDFCAADAVSRGFAVIKGEPNVLLLDLDSAEAVAQYMRVIEVVQRYIDIDRIERWPSKGGNVHMRITLAQGYDITTRLLLQAALGSDGVKEVLTLLRVRNGVHEPSMLFQPPNAVVVDVLAEPAA